MCGRVLFCVCVSHFAPVSVSPGLLRMRSSLFCRAAAFFSPAERHTSVNEKECTQSGHMRSVQNTQEWHSPAGGFSFSFFFFLHFQGLKMRPRLASLLLRRTGGVRTPETKQPGCSALCCSIASTTHTKTKQFFYIF